MLVKANDVRGIKEFQKKKFPKTEAVVSQLTLVRNNSHELSIIFSLSLTEV